MAQPVRDLPLGICTLHHRGSWFFAFVHHRGSWFFAIVLPFRSPTRFFADVCSILRLSLICFVTIVCSAPALIIFIGSFYTLANARTSSCEL
jgi:hypothetical protein